MSRSVYVTLEEFNEFLRLREENPRLLEQVRTLSAELHGMHRTKYLVLKGSEAVTRAPHQTATSRMLLTDEIVTQSKAEVFAHACRRMQHEIEALARDDKRKPLDYIWRLTMERDFHA